MEVRSLIIFNLLDLVIPLLKIYVRELEILEGKACLSNANMVRSFFFYHPRGSLSSLLGLEWEGIRIQAFRVNKKMARQLEDTGYLPRASQGALWSFMLPPGCE